MRFRNLFPLLILSAGCATAVPRLEPGPVVFERSMAVGEYSVVRLEEGKTYVLEVRSGRISVHVTPDRPGTLPPLISSNVVGIRIQPSATAEYRILATGGPAATGLVQLRELVPPQTPPQAEPDGD
ncbi:MAG TPA: hypothetical protein VFS94_02650 [Gemmatimonadales bacterium]|nr:hypothetical protein [Gemmatimonadales bacterium]